MPYWRIAWSRRVSALGVVDVARARRPGLTVWPHTTFPQALNAGMRALRSAGVQGVMVDLWWGIVEAEGPEKYNWGAPSPDSDQPCAAALQLCDARGGDLINLPHFSWII